MENQRSIMEPGFLHLPSSVTFRHNVVCGCTMFTFVTGYVVRIIPDLHGHSTLMGIWVVDRARLVTGLLWAV